MSATSAATRRRRPLSPAVSIPKLGLRPSEAADVIGSEQLFRDMRSADWIKPVFQSNNVTLFDFAHVAKCFARISRGERPAPKKDGPAPISQS